MRAGGKKRRPIPLLRSMIAGTDEDQRKEMAPRHQRLTAMLQAEPPEPPIGRPLAIGSGRERVVTITPVGGARSQSAINRTRISRECRDQQNRDRRRVFYTRGRGRHLIQKAHNFQFLLRKHMADEIILRAAAA
jgi:hypothetical protein